MPRDADPIAALSSVKQEMSNSDNDDDDDAPPQLEMEAFPGKAENLEEEEEEEEAETPKQLTLSELLGSQLSQTPSSSSWQKNNGKKSAMPAPLGLYSKTRSTRAAALASKNLISASPSTSGTSSGSKTTFMSVVGKRYSPWNSNDDSTPPKKATRLSTSSKRTSAASAAASAGAAQNDIQSLLQNQTPIRVDVAFGNGGTSSPSSNDHDESSPTSNNNDMMWNFSGRQNPEASGGGAGPSGGSNNKLVKDSVHASIQKRDFPGDLISSASNHNLLLGCMLINGLTEVQKRERKRDYADMCADLFQTLQKYNVS